jgi:hypothetical protein
MDEMQLQSYTAAKVAPGSPSRLRACIGRVLAVALNVDAEIIEKKIVNI